ncbi:MAG: hypothetical protein HYX92_11495 [Chloroflexi bacterium]|nr:hypothetical protein [Chloroflexota bacterium]
MLNVVRERMRAHLLAHAVGVLSISGGQGSWATAVRYRVAGLELDCLVPRWADVAYHLEKNPSVMVVVLASALPNSRKPLCWLEYRGTARPVRAPDWSGLLPNGANESLAGELYLVVRVSPKRLDLVDESRGWGARETLDA